MVGGHVEYHIAGGKYGTDMRDEGSVVESVVLGPFQGQHSQIFVSSLEALQ